MKLSVHRILLGAVLMASIPATASAQRAMSTAGYNGEGMPYRDCNQDGETAEDEPEISTGPANVSGSVTARSGVSAADAERLRRQQEELQRKEIQQYDQLLSSMPPDYPRRAEILFRKAEAWRQLADATYLAERAKFNECMQNWYACTSDSECYEPLPDYAESITLYEEVARSFPNYERLDEVIFRLGETLIENDKAQVGVQYLTRLVNAYPSSQYVCDARFLMGDHFFDNDLLIAARQNYDEVTKFSTCELFNAAIYKLAWVDINDREFENAIERFQTVVKNIDASQDQRLDFRNQALNDMLLAYAELENGWQMAREYYEGYEGEGQMRKKLGALSGLFDEQGKDEERVAVLSYFMGRYPNDELQPQWAEQQLDSLQKIGNWDRYEARAREFITQFDPNSMWSLQNAGNDKALANGRLLAEGQLLYIITRNSQESERLKNSPQIQQALMLEVAADYDQYFQRFPDSKDAYEQRFYYAELLYYQIANKGDWSEKYWLPRDRFDGYLREAGKQYRQVVEMKPDPQAEYAHKAATGALYVYDDFMKREVPDIDAPLPPPNKFVFVDPPVELGQASKDYVEIVAWYSKLYPEDEAIPGASWRAASLYLRAGHAEEAAQRFETIIEHHPRHRFAQEAALAAFVCYNKAENWVKIESVARKLLTEVCGKNRTDICEREKLESAIAYAMNNQSNDLMEAGRKLEVDGDDRAAREKFLAAADKRVALYTEFPQSEWSPTALYNAAATYERARRIDTSIDLFNKYVTSYPEHELQAEAHFTLAMIYDSQARFAEAADWFEKVDRFEKFEQRANALYLAGRLREAMGEVDRAIGLYDRFIGLQGTTDQAKNVVFIIAEAEKARGNLDASFDRYAKFLDRYKDDAPRRLVAVSRQAGIRKEQNRANDSLALYQQVYNMFGAGTATFENELFKGWSVAPGGNFTDEAQRRSVLPYAAEARFWLAEGAFAKAKAQTLDYPEGKWKVLADNLKKRGELIVAAQREMFEVANFGDAEWAVAASLRIGQLYHAFYRDIFALPAPDLDTCYERYAPEDCDMVDEKYNEMLYEIGEPLTQKAMSAYQNALNVARTNKVYTSWTQNIVAEMNDLDRSFRKGGAEGVVATNTNDLFLNTNYILDLSDKLVRFEKFSAQFEEQQRLLEQQRFQQQSAPGADGAAPTIPVQQ